VLLGDEDALPPPRAAPDLLRQLRLAQLRPRLVDAADAAAAVPGQCRSAAIAELADSSFTPEKVAGRARLSRPPLEPRVRAALWLGVAALSAPRSFAASERWAAELEPLARAFAERLRAYLPILTYPIRVGTHFNTAFALILSLEWAERSIPLADAIRDRARTGSAPTAIARRGSRAATTADLVELDALEQRLEIALAEALVALALDDLEEDRADHVLGEDLQQQALALGRRAVDQDAALLELGGGLAMALDALGSSSS
jgi:hypothetical protein